MLRSHLPTSAKHARLALGLTALSSVLGTRFAHAEPPQLAVEAAAAPTPGNDTAATLGAPERAVSASDTGSDDGYWRRYAPAANSWEVGAFVGGVFVSDANSFRGDAITTASGPQLRPFNTFEQPAAELGVRAGYYPFSFAGAELEGMFAAASSERGEGVPMFAARTHLVAQSPLWSVVPFVLAGVGYWQSNSDNSGSDGDPAFHFGGGAKVNLTNNLAVRVDVRDTITNKRPLGNHPHHIEALAGASIVLGRPDKAKDSDGDGVIDARDQCPVEAGTSANGCPAVDSDGDGLSDNLDECVQQPGPAPSGCPAADADHDGVLDASDQCVDVKGSAPSGCPDSDADGVIDRDDICPETAGVAPQGCPLDADADGITDADRCPEQPETKNGFEDADGCPDEMPTAVKDFMGVIAGIEFETDRDAIQPSSEAVLEEAVRVLEAHPSLRVEIVGYTDDRGGRDYNLQLSERRANAVKAHLVSRGIAASRIEARGAGADNPIAPNTTGEGRQKNRRIEFRVIR